MNADPACAKQHSQSPSDEVMIMGDAGELANAFVYIKEGIDTSLYRTEKLQPVQLDQSGCLYQPRVMGLRVGQTLEIINSDPTMHNVHSMADKNKTFNIAMATKGQVIDKTFTRPEVMIPVKCDVHPWMRSYIGVVEHPHFKVTDSSGKYAFDSLPPGKYLIEVWHEKLGSKRAAVVIPKPGFKQSLDISFSE